MQTTLDLLPQYSLPLLAVMVAAIVASFVVVRLAAGPAVSLARRWGLLATRLTLIVLLLALLANPVRVAENPGTVNPADVFFLLDASESMALDDAGTTRWDQAVGMIRQSVEQAADSTRANVSLFRFGRRLQAVSSPQVIGLPHDGLVGTAQDGAEAPPRVPKEEPSEIEADIASTSGPSEPDTQMLVALRQVTSRFGRRPPAGVVVFSDGRARDAEATEEVAAHYAQLGVPIHVVPMGNVAKGGDVSVVSLIAPATVRKHSEVNVHAFVRSYGYSGVRAEVELLAVDPSGNTPKKLDSAPITLEDGFQSVNLSFQSDETTRTLKARVQPRPDEIATENNEFETDVRVDRTKIRVLYVEGSPMRYTTVQRAGQIVARGPHSDLQEALEEDPDVECTVLSVSGSRIAAVSGQVNSFPRTPAELSAYDAIILSSVPSSAFTNEQLAWIDQWIGKRGAGLCMVGGRYSFASGGWDASPLEKILPVQTGGGTSWDSARAVAVTPDTTEPLHPIFRLLEDRTQNRKLLQAFPGFRGVHAGLMARPNVATVLAAGVTGDSVPTREADRGFFRRLLTGGRSPGGPDEGSDRPFPAITAGRYGRGRTLALAMPITGPAAEEFRAWGVRGNQYYARFWRNTIYWLTENSFVGRRRLAASADKRFYQPGENVTLTAIAYDEAANTTTDYRLVAMIEPQSLDIDSDYALVRWPSGLERASGEQGPLVMWGEEFEIPVQESEDGQSIYSLGLTLADAQAMGQSTGGMRLELTAYEDYTQVDSTSIPLQVLHDPFEQQNPFPNHDLLKTLAARSEGSVLSSPAQLADVLNSAPVTTGPPEIHRTPVWSNWWLLVGLMGVLTLEWCWRRHVGLA